MHWKIFLQYIEQIDVKGNDIPDAYHAALAMEWNCIWVTTDKGFKRFKGLKVRHPLVLSDSWCSENDAFISRVSLCMYFNVDITDNRFFSMMRIIWPTYVF